MTASRDETEAGSAQPGLLPREEIEALIAGGAVQGDGAIEDGQLQPASLDLRLGAKAYRVRASFLTGRNHTVAERLEASDTIDLTGDGAVLERGCVYVVPLLETLDLPASISAAANPKSSTGRLDIFTRLITDGSDVFDRVARRYKGRLYAEVSPRSFSVRVHRGSKLNQIRFRRHGGDEALSSGIDDRALFRSHGHMPLVDGALDLRGGLILRVALGAESIGATIGYKAQKHTDPIDVDKVGAYDPREFWEPIHARPDGRLILDPGEFYILASHERLHIPPELAAEMVPIDPAMGEFRVHYAGFFDPGFGSRPDGQPGARAVLEVRSHEVPFILEDGQVIGRLVYEKMAAPPRLLYGASGVSNYQGQGLKLSKHFRAY